MKTQSETKPVVAHSVGTWLRLTATWIYNQVKHNGAFSSIVLTRSIQNIDQFPWYPLYINSYKHNSPVFRLLRKCKILPRDQVFNEAIRKHRPCILHSHFGDIGWSDLPTAKKNGLKHVVTFYGYDVSRLPMQHSCWGNRYRKLFDRADLFLCEGPHMGRCLVRLGCPEEKVRVQRLGVDVQRIPFMPRIVNSDGLVKVLIAGTFREKKGIRYALESIGILKSKYPNIRVTLIGDSTGEQRDQEEKKRILEVIKDYDMGSILRMLGYQPYDVLLKEAYRHHIFLSPSVTARDGDTEGGSPVTITEMAASGMPVVSTWHCDIPEVVLDSKSGFLVKEGDIEELTLAVEKLITAPESWKQFGEVARKHIEEKFDVTACAQSLNLNYMSLLQQHGWREQR